MTANNRFDDWWKQAVVYQVYPRSFKDVNGDGIGDIAGITSKIDYLRDLGVDALWLSPFYPSELADGGYDVIDYRNVDSHLGTMHDFDELTKAAHAAGMKVIVDIVPNHTSNKHPFFEEALKAGRGSAARDRYIFREGRGDHGELPPNDWIAAFGGSAWQRVDDGQWYLHLFTKQQPDLNWQNSDVRRDFIKTLRFWSDHGTDGFRIDVAHGLAKDLDSLPLDELAQRYTVQDTPDADTLHPLWDRPEVHEIYKQWRQVFNEYVPPRFAVGEAWVTPEHQHLYASPEELGQVFNFEFAKADWLADSMRRAIRTGLDAAKHSGGSTTTWVMSNHDIVRHASRYALPQVPANTHHQIAHDWVLRDGKSYYEDRNLGSKRARAAILMELGLPGSVYVYQGEELGLFEVADIPWDQLEDPTARLSARNLYDKGRDGCRVPLPWNTHEPSFGFSPSTQANGSPALPAHLPQPKWYRDFAADVEEADKSSMLHLYRRALELRQVLLTSTRQTSCVQLDYGTYYSDVRPNSLGTLREAYEFCLRSGQQLDWNDRVVAYIREINVEALRTCYPNANVDCSASLAFLSITNFNDYAISLPNEMIIARSDGHNDSSPLASDSTAWIACRVR